VRVWGGDPRQNKPKQTFRATRPGVALFKRSQTNKTNKQNKENKPPRRPPRARACAACVPCLARVPAFLWVVLLALTLGVPCDGGG